MRKAALFIAIAALLVFGCVQSPQQPVVNEPAPAPAPQQNATQAAQCSTGNTVQNDNCFLALAREKSDPSFCHGIYSIGTLDTCYAIFANSSLAICEQITDAGMRTGCLTAIAEANKSQDICDLIQNPEQQAACLKSVVPPCQLVLDPDARALCMALEKGNYTLCQSDSCLEQYAQNRSDAAACGPIASEPERHYCMAAVAGSAAPCANASQQAFQDLCYQKAAAYLNDSAVCDLATKGSDYADACYLYFAVNDSDMSYCSRPIYTGLRDTCYTDYAIIAADTSACPRIFDTLNQIGCYFFAAGANRLPSLCNPLQNAGQQNDCYARAVTQPALGPVPSDCPKVTSEAWRNKCYYRAAQLSGNQTLCAPITPGPDKDSCDALFGISG